MSDAIANISGTDLFATREVPAWHRKGTVFTEDVFTAAEMLDRVPVLRDRVVTLEPVYVGTPQTVTDPETEQEVFMGLDSPVEVPSVFASVSNWSDGHRSFYGSVGARYGVVQDVNAFRVFDGFRAETIGALYDGRKTFATFAVDRETVLDPSGVADVVKMYGLAVNSHDGTSPITWATTPVRVVCQNTLNAAMGTLKNVRKIRHTATAEDRMSEHAATYRATLEYADRFDALARAMFAAKVTDKQYDNLFVSLFGKAPEVDVKGSLTKYENKRDMFQSTWNLPANAGIRGTAWGAWNAITEANQYGRNERSGSRGEDAFTAAGMGLDGPTNTFRQSSLDMVLDRVGIKAKDLMPA